MKIGILGTGHMASTLGQHWAEKGHPVFFGSRTPEKAIALAGSIGHGAKGGSITEAAAFGEVLLLGVPWNSAEQTLKTCGPLDGKILIDCVNPLQNDYKSLAIGFTTSAAEEIANWAPGAKIVKAFNTISDKVIRLGPQFGSEVATAFYCGNDPAAKDVVAGLIRDLGFDPIDTGNLCMARYLEPMTSLFIHVAMNGMGSNIAFKLLKR
ncbi:MAG: NADPH-dependent F420 reductase [Chlorobiales bacterium]|jgi:8-hydroxy-5-deazaflavin:NADPH oxidoreductase|nr:NADPH-dependent F420 reductase [Chlorobiales bacterium]